MKAFVSWSGERSRAIAEALRELIPMLLQSVDVWMSAADIEKGALWDTSITDNLNSADLGIVCLTPENLQSPWILFESGALSKQVTKSRVCTYLFKLRPQDVPPPLGLFQHTISEKEDTQKLVHSINTSCPVPLSVALVDRLFDAMWPTLEKQLKSLAESPTQVPIPRSTDDILAELLNISRNQSERGNDQILGKLQHIETAMMMLSYRTLGRAQMDHVAFEVLNIGRKHFPPKGTDHLETTWNELAKIVEKQRIANSVKTEGKEADGTASAKDGGPDQEGDISDALTNPA